MDGNLKKKRTHLLPQAISLLSGKDFWLTRDIPELGFGALKFTDGPNGARGEHWTDGIAGLCFPCASALGASFDRTLLRQVGTAIAIESLAKGANGLLAPTVNIHRYLLNGRNFESYSEDPHLSGHLAAEYIKGVQSKKVAASPKHFIGNEAENGRRWSDSIIDERTLREIYLEPFRILIKESSPLCLMTAYNSCNGNYCSESEPLLQIVRKDWNYQGLIISDWFGTYSTSKALNAGLDLEMPGPTKFRTEEMIKAAIESGELDSQTLATATQRVINLLKQTDRLCLQDPADSRGKTLEQSSQPNKETKALLRRAATDSMVLLANKNGALPIEPDTQNKKIAIIGRPANEPAIFGGGSASLKTAYVSRPTEALLQEFPGAVFSEGVAVQRLTSLGSELRSSGSDVQLKWYNSPEPDEQHLFRTEILPQSQYMMMEDIHAGLLDTQSFSTSMTVTIQPSKTGWYRLSLTSPGEQVCFLDGVKIAQTARGPDVVKEDYIFHQARLEACFDLPEQLEASKNYSCHIITKSARHTPVHINREFYVQGGRFGLEIIPDDAEDIQRARDVAASCCASIVHVGTSPQWESEGFDRLSFQLPRAQDLLIREVAKASTGPVIVVINAGSPVDMTGWIDDVDAVLYAWFPGQEYGNALADIITGRVTPSARLPTTIPKSLQDTPAGDLHPVTDTSLAVEKKIVYKEGLQLGYRAYSFSQPNCTPHRYSPLFSFGHGLSYTQFSYMDPEQAILIDSADEFLVNVSVTVRNDGAVPGAEVVQLYLQPLETAIERPEVELGAFAKTTCLAPGQTERVHLLLPKDSFSFWDVNMGCWKVGAGNYRVLFAGARGVGDWVTQPDAALNVSVSGDLYWSR